MKVPCDTGFQLLKSNISNIATIKKDLTGLGRIHSFKPGKFDALLNAEMKATRLAGDIPLEQDILQQLIRIVQKQMSDYLTFSVFEALGSPGFQGSLLDRIKIPQGSLTPASASKNQHPLQKEKDDEQTLRDINRIADSASKKYGVDSGLVKAVIKAESDFDVGSTSHKGAMGLMQLMPDTAKDLGVENPYNPVENVMGGTRYLKILLDRYDGDINLALAAYNWGMGNVEKHPGRLPEETKIYMARVNKYHSQEIS